jgi:sialate O-acetylesterase
MKHFFLFVALLCATAASAQETKLAPIFNDHMVLQRDLPATIWGTGKTDDKLTIEFAGQRQTTTVDKDGHWQVALKPLAASTESRDLTVRSAAGQPAAKITDVLVGEVWIGSGQSNMEWTLNRTANAQDAAAKAGDPLLRLFTVARIASPTPVREVTGQWAACTSSNVLSFSAVNYYFGRDLRRALNVPVGLITTAWGGTPAQAWTPREAMLAEPALQGMVEKEDQALAAYDPAKAEEQYQAALAKWKQDAEKAKAENKPAPRQPRKPAKPGAGAGSPAALYNGMVAPLVPLTCRGVIWYQGEANNKAADQYRILFPTMIKSWRQAFGRDFPFLFVQIAPFDGMSPEIRDAQLFTWRTVPGTAMTVITDHGEAGNIHPVAKEPVGARLALAARALAYGEKITYSGPLFDKVQFHGQRAILSFQHTGTGLVAKDGPLHGFEIAGNGTNFVPAVATIEGHQVIVQSEQVAEPKAVRYGWANVPEVNLFNQEGLPATPFHTATGK